MWVVLSALLGLMQTSCVGAPPVLALTQTQIEAAPGAQALFALSLHNMNSAGCAPVTFDVRLTPPDPAWRQIGWDGVVGDKTIASGATQTIFLHVGVPLSAMAGTYPLPIAVAQDDLPEGMNVATIAGSILVRVPPPLPVATVTSDKIRYGLGATALLTVKTSPGASVIVHVRLPNGQGTALPAKTADSAGRIAARFLVSRDPAARGTYEVSAEVRRGTQVTSSPGVLFTVN